MIDDGSEAGEQSVGLVLAGTLRSEWQDVLLDTWAQENLSIGCVAQGVFLRRDGRSLSRLIKVCCGT